MTEIILKDPLYKQVLVDKKYLPILDSPEFQRLRYIKQTSFSYQVYPSANHTRFSHSIGAYHLMKKVLSNGLIQVSKQKREELELAALLHDIGHGPFSHMWEKVFPHFDHEQTTREILKRFKLDKVINILEKKSPYSYLISSTLDVDKLDYMARDSYFTGVSYGVMEVDFILQHLYLKDNKLVIKPSALSSVEDLITQRYNLYKTVYYHKISLEFDFLFQSIFDRVKFLLEKHKITIKNSHLLSFFNKTNTVDDLLALTDDVIVYYIRLWSTHSDTILSDLSSRFLYRTKLMAKNLEYSKINAKKIETKIESSKYDKHYYFKHFKLPITLVQTPVYVEIDKSIQPLEKVSSLIKHYNSKKFGVEILIYPRDLE
jgi:hypothetical protein